MANTIIGKPIPTSKYYFDKYLSPKKRQSGAEMKPTIVDFELTSKCGGACTYCYASSPFFAGENMPTEMALGVIDDLVEMGVTQVQWCGGDPVLHEDWQKIIGYAGERGINNSVFVAGIVTTRLAKALAELQNIHLVGVNFDTIDPDDFMGTHISAKVLEQKYKAIKYLRAAGFHPSRIMPCLTLTSFSAHSIEATMDWLVDEMGAGYVPMFVYHPIGEGADSKYVPSPEQIQRAYEYRAKKLGDHWLSIGPTECGRHYCRSKFHVTYDGRILPCAVLYDFEVGNVKDTPLQELIADHGKKLCYDFEVNGACASCDNNDVCWGCRANAYFYKGDVTASDPMCWLNDESITTDNASCPPCHGPAQAAQKQHGALEKPQ